MATDLAVRDDAETVALAEQQQAGLAALLHVLGTGDLSKLTDRERAGHYKRLCLSLGLNELSRPFDWIWFKDRDGEPDRLVLYPNQSCTAQLRRQHHMRIQITRREVVGELFVVEATAYTPDGREDVASKYVPLTNKYGRLKGNLLANAMMKAETGAKRRVTLSMIGLSSPPDADEVVSWRPATIDGTGRIIANPTAEQKALAENPRMARTIGEPVFEDAEVADGDVVSQAVRPEELQQAQRTDAPRPSFRASEEDIRRWCGAWFAIVDETSWDTKEARARFVAEFTADWPQAKRTDSMRTMFARCQEPEARDFLAKIRAVVGVWKEGQAAEANGEPELGSDVGMTPETAAEEIVSQEGRRSYEQLFPEDEAAPAPAGMTPEGHAAAVLTGAPATPQREEGNNWPARLEPGADYSRPELFELYEQWAERMKTLDATWRPDDVKRLPDGALRKAIGDVIAQADDLAEYLATIGNEPAEDDDQAESGSAS